MTRALSRKQIEARSQKGPKQQLLTRPVLVPSTARLIGYARVSRDDQNLAVQLGALRDAGVHNLFVEKVSARNGKRPQFNLMMKFIEPGDTLIIYAFNRLVRSVKLLLTIIDDFKAQGIGLRSTSEPHINPFTTHGRLMATLTGGVDEHEVNRLADRTRDAMREHARQGAVFGRQAMVDDKDIPDMRQMRWDDGVPVSEIAERYKIAISTVYFYTKKPKKSKK